MFNLLYQLKLTAFETGHRNYGPSHVKSLIPLILAVNDAIDV